MAMAMQIIGVHCEACGAEVYDPLDRVYDPERSQFVCERCARLESETRHEQELVACRANRAALFADLSDLLDDLKSDRHPAGMSVSRSRKGAKFAVSRGNLPRRDPVSSKIK